MLWVSRWCSFSLKTLSLSPLHCSVMLVLSDASIVFFCTLLCYIGCLVYLSVSSLCYNYYSFIIGFLLSSANLPLLSFKIAFAVLGLLYLHMHLKNQLIIFYTHKPVGFCLANIDWFGNFSHLYWAFQIMSMVCLSIYLDILISFNNVLVSSINVFE